MRAPAEGARERERGRASGGGGGDNPHPPRSLGQAAEVPEGARLLPAAQRRVMHRAPWLCPPFAESQSKAYVGEGGKGRVALFRRIGPGVAKSHHHRLL